MATLAILGARASSETRRGTQESVKYQDILYTQSQDILYTKGAEVLTL
jgi:hypothetical protein